MMNKWNSYNNNNNNCHENDNRNNSQKDYYNDKQSYNCGCQKKPLANENSLGPDLKVLPVQEDRQVLWDQEALPEHRDRKVR